MLMEVDKRDVTADTTKKWAIQSVHGQTAFYFSLQKIGDPDMQHYHEPFPHLCIYNSHKTEDSDGCYIWCAYIICLHAISEFLKIACVVTVNPYVCSAILITATGMILFVRAPIIVWLLAKYIL